MELKYLLFLCEQMNYLFEVQYVSDDVFLMAKRILLGKGFKVVNS